MAKTNRKTTNKEVPLSELERTVGLGCPFDPPPGFTSWANYVYLMGNTAPKPYKSWLEFRLFAYGCLKGVAYEPKTLPYQEVKNRSYTPDGIQGRFLLEVKGRFYSPDEATKYLHIRKSLPEGQELVFIFGNPGVSMPKAQPRKDGSRMTQEEWARKNGFRFFFENDPELHAKLEELLNEGAQPFTEGKRP